MCRTTEQGNYSHVLFHKHHPVIHGGLHGRNATPRLKHTFISTININHIQFFNVSHLENVIFIRRIYNTSLSIIFLPLSSMCCRLPNIGMRG
ncbi:hypothetical protein CDV36_006769 [Fusarium kuroshium]|uniref:Uncharacterized protein n=2 Tax=Fusarium solani species complex TaxID=232080 RepID=A0A3M2S8U9_9HYPO|nr:hypothetical protein CDV36_006769 [Fusarium kuroshium]RSL74190.1 hypothetical protein CEP51_011642 [Fusarium floridanum]